MGESIPLTINVGNGTSRTDIRFRASVVRQTTFRCVGFTKETTDDLATILSPLGAIGANTECTWNADNLMVPATILPTVEGTEIITMEETLEVSAEVPNFWGFDASPITFRLKIGNVPIKDNVFK